MSWLFVAVMLVVAIWSLWNGFEAYSFARALALLHHDLNDQTVRRFLDHLQEKGIPPARLLRERLREGYQRVEAASTVSPGMKACFRTVMKAQGLQE